jgi:glycopeptide antibiotics resistance protein
VPEIQSYQPLPDNARLLSKYGFYFSISIFLYSVLFPFRFDFSSRQLWAAWSQAGFIPYWSAKKGMHVTADDLANILLTIPMGFAGVLHYAGRHRMSRLYQWWALGLAFGLAAELIQLAIPTRASVVTDAINNGFGSFLGAAAASVMGQGTLRFFTGTASERRNIYLWMLVLSLVAMLGPYDLGPDCMSRLGTSLRILQNHPWGSGTLMGKEWVRMAGFALIGALAIRLPVPGRRKPSMQRSLAAAALVLPLPVVLECARLLVESGGPSLGDLALDVFAALAGALAGLLVPPALRAFSGFLLFNVALAVAGLSPYRFSSWQPRVSFQWIPFYEFCSSRTLSSLSDAIISFFSFAILGGLLLLSFQRCSRWQVAVYALAFSGATELAQTFLPARTAGITDILVAGLGAWTGAYFCAAVESSRLGLDCSLQPNLHRASH